MYSKEFGIGKPITDVQAVKGVKSTARHPNLLLYSTKSENGLAILLNDLIEKSFSPIHLNSVLVYCLHQKSNYFYLRDPGQETVPYIIPRT